MSPEETVLFLENSSANEIYNFFEKEKKYSFRLKHPLIQKFIKDGNKLILMALAKFSHDFDTVKYLYENSNNVAIRVAALANDRQIFDVMFYTFMGITPEIKQIKKFLDKSTLSEIKAYFQNKNYREDQIIDLLEKKPPYDDIEEEKYKSILLCLLKNPNRLSKYSMGNMPEDGLTWHANYKASNLFVEVFRKYFPKAKYDLEKLYDI